MHKKIINLHAVPALMMCSTLLGAGFAEMDIKGHIKTSFVYVWGFSILCMLAAVAFSIMPL